MRLTSSRMKPSRAKLMSDKKQINGVYIIYIKIINTIVVKKHKIYIQALI